MSNDTIVQIITVIGPALLTFLAGHYHILLKNPAAPATPDAKPAPAQPATPAPVAPETPLPIGKGGLLQLFSFLLQGISQHPTATDAEKVAAGNAALVAIQPLIVK